MESTMARTVPKMTKGLGLFSELRVYEKLCLGFFAYLTAAAFIFPLDLRLRLVVLPLNLLAASVLILVSRSSSRRDDNGFLAHVRNWLPCILILAAYRESGLYFIPDPSHRLDDLLIRLDDVILQCPVVVRVLEAGAPWLQRYLEFSYFLCYPMVPLGLASLYLVHNETKNGLAPAVGAETGAPGDRCRHNLRRSGIDRFWLPVLAASFTCYLLFPLFPLTPPRELFHDVPGPQVAPLLRGMNGWLLGHYAVGASLFPSAHVAATTAMALTLRRYLPRFAWVFVIVAASIALATVYGRYHYAADALAGAMVGYAGYFIASRWSGDVGAEDAEGRFPQRL